MELLLWELVVSPVMLGLSAADQEIPALLLFAVSKILRLPPLHKVVLPVKANCGVGLTVTVMN